MKGTKMSQDLQSLLDKIKQDGIEKAAAQEKEIISNAEKKSAEIIAQAKQEAAQILKNAEIESENLRKRAESAVQQASRDIILTLKNEIQGRLNKIFANTTAQAFSAEYMASIIADLCKTFAADSETKLTVVSAVKDVDALKNALMNALADSFKNNCEVFPDKELSGGFKVNFSGNDVFYDFSDDAVCSLLAQYAGPVVGDLLKK